MERNYKWYKIAVDENEISFQDNGMVVIEVNGKRISMARHENELFAFAYMCPHASGILADGWLDAKGCVICPVHKYRFHLRNGRNITGEGYYLKHWPVEKREDGIFVGMEEDELFTAIS